MSSFQRNHQVTLATCWAAALAYALGLTWLGLSVCHCHLGVFDTRRSTIKQAYQRFMSTFAGPRSQLSLFP